MKLRKIEKVVAFIAGGTVSVAGLLGVYTLSGPVLDAPIVLTIPEGVMDIVGGEHTSGLYVKSLPDFIFLTPQGEADDATLPHEMLHYVHPTWTECEVSDYLYSITGLVDGYHGRTC